MKTLKKALKSIFENLLLFTVIAGIVFYFSSLILNDFGLQYRFWIKKMAIILFALFAFSGMIQVIYHLKRLRSRILLTVATIVTIIGLFPFGMFWGVAYMDTTEEIVVRNDKTMVARIETEFLGDRYISYYEYANAIVCDNEAVLKLKHLNGGFNPKSYYTLNCTGSDNDLEKMMILSYNA